jgi:hypothetical protein
MKETRIRKVMTKHETKQRLDLISMCERAIALAIMNNDREAELKFINLLNEAAAPMADFIA